MNAVNIVVITTLLLGAGSENKDFTGPGWYRMSLQNGKEFTLRVLQRDKNGFHCSYQGLNFQLKESQVTSIKSLLDLRDPTEQPSLSGRDEIKIREAVDQLADLDKDTVSRAATFLKSEFKSARGVLRESLKHREAGVRRMIARLIGEEGEVSRDLEVLARLLNDSDKSVRLAALLAIRNFGPEAMDPVMEFISREIEPNHRKAAIKTLERWRDPRCAPFLVEHMQKEYERGVRKYIARALKTLLKKDFGDDPAAWQKYMISARLVRKTDNRDSRRGKN